LLTRWASSFGGPTQSGGLTEVRIASVLALCWLSAACSETNASAPPPQSPADADAGVASVHVRFDLGPGSAMTFGSIPFPDDLYLDRQGRVQLAQFPEPGAANDYARALLDGLSDLDGFGASSPIYFFLDGALDPSSLPQSAADSLAAQASVLLLDADTGSPDAFQPMRVELQWQPGANRLALRPALGHPLVAGRRYAALVTRRVKDQNGQPLQASPAFVAVRDTSVSLSDARLLQARAEYTPVLETLSKRGMQRDDVVAMAVFRVQNVNRDLEAARRIVRASKPPAAANLALINESGLDTALGHASDDEKSTAAPHASLLALVHGTLASPSFVSATAKTHGAWQRDEADQLRVKRTDDVPFTLFVPRGGGNLPIVIYQHQAGRERSDAVFVANALAARGIAVLAIDAPFQGLRARPADPVRGVDTRNRFTGVSLADRFGDEAGDFYGVQENNGGLIPLHPFYARDAVRQGVVDLMTAVRFVEEGDFSVIVNKDSALAGHKFGAPRLGFIGEDVGAQMGVLLSSFEPNLQALVLFGAGTGIAQDWWRSPANESPFGELARRLGYDSGELDYESDAPAFWPGLSVYDMLAGRGEAQAYSSLLRRAPVNTLLMAAREDELVANLLSESLAASLGASLLSEDPRYVGDLAREDVEPGASFSGNFKIESDFVTRAMRVYEPADHSLLLSGIGTQNFAHPAEPPYRRLAMAEILANPTSLALEQIADYFRSFFDCVGTGSTNVARKCEASVSSPAE
jgi:hypothetical protein